MTGNFQAIAADLKVGSEELKTELQNDEKLL